MKTYMIIEHFKPGASDAVYARFHDKGRMLPSGLSYVQSWLSADRCRCFQLMQTDDPALFAAWFARWDDLVTFDVYEIGAPPLPEPPLAGL